MSHKPKLIQRIHAAQKFPTPARTFLMVRPLSTQFPRGSIQLLKEASIVLLTNGQVLVKAAWVEFHKTVRNVYMYCFLIVQPRAASFQI